MRMVDITAGQATQDSSDHITDHVSEHRGERLADRKTDRLSERAAELSAELHAEKIGEVADTRDAESLGHEVGYFGLHDTTMADVDITEQLRMNLARLADLHGRLNFMMREMRSLIKV